MTAPPRCLLIVPSALGELYSRLVAAFADDPQVFVLRDRRDGEGSLDAVGMFAVGGGDLDAALRHSVAEKLRSLGVQLTAEPALPSPRRHPGRRP
jgi:hypothetical protein